MYSPSCIIVTFLLLFFGCSASRLYRPPSNEENTKMPLQTFRPFNVAHRGSNGVLPEETAPAYLRAIEEGADFIEADILVSKDGVLMCLHDVTLDNTTDIAEHKEFADRVKTYEVEGENKTGFFIFDFTLKELKTLRTKQRCSFRDPQYNGRYPIITFEEYIQIAINAPRVVGIYPEIKNPVLLNQYVKWPKGKRFEDVVVEILKKHGYKGSYLSKEWLKQPCFIQSFAPSSLFYIHKQTDLPKIFLIDDVHVRTQDTNQTYAEITSDHYLNYIKEYVVGIGPCKDNIVPVKDNYTQTPTDLVTRAHSHNLKVQKSQIDYEVKVKSLFPKVQIDADFLASSHKNPSKLYYVNKFITIIEIFLKLDESCVKTKSSFSLLTSKVKTKFTVTVKRSY